MTAQAFGERSSGVLLHLTSLPGPYGGGDLGPAAHRFVEFLARAGQRYWQMLPCVPPGGGDSPYDSPSAFAGSPWLVSLELLARDGLLEPSDLVAPSRLRDAPRTLFNASKRFRTRRLKKAFVRFMERPGARHELDRALEAHANWLPDYALFEALKRAHGGKPWTTWPAELVRRDPAALEHARREVGLDIDFTVFVQREFARQWGALRGRCRELGVRLLGDVPMFVAHDAADVWSNQSLFQLHSDGQRRVVAGVPPDYFSADGQLWGNPVYDWGRLKETGYAWWIARLRGTLQRFDAARLDHFIGFHRYWQVPAGATSAKEGHYVEAPGHDFLERLRDALGGLPFVAEDLGVLTEGVVRLRDDFELPGMRILTFAFGSDWREYQPHRYPRRVVAYTGTHDNDTLLGWLTSADRETDPRRRTELELERDRALAYANSDGREAHWDLVHTLVQSVADTTIFPIQDLLGLGTGARMNVPGVAHGNWTFRVPESALTLALAERLGRLCDVYERIPEGVRRNA
ncbi:MAG TPA: 4-alpha-glucanotransferase [Polyangiaceae bacterium]|jgi:4-alpha-glucanotransferase|nr:4-alpha-glucanotransferase [Polyangiaceae bacterium]